MFKLHLLKHGDFYQLLDTKAREKASTCSGVISTTTKNKQVGIMNYLEEKAVNSILKE